MTYYMRTKTKLPVAKVGMGFAGVFKFDPNHDPKTGRFASAGMGSGEFTDLDRSLVDHQGGNVLGDNSRSLSDKTQIRRIDKFIPGAKYTPYTQTPFFSKLQELQGNPGETDGAANEEARKTLMRKQPVETLPIKSLRFTQGVVNVNSVAASVSRGGTTKSGAVMVVRHRGTNYLIDGHHRAVSQAVLGAKDIKANVLNLDKPETIKKDNPFHEPGGSPEGGRFARAPGAAISASGGVAAVVIDRKAQARPFALAIYAHAAKEEKHLTSLIEKVLPPDAQLVGLEHRQKTVGSISRKIATDAKNEKVPVAEAAPLVSDALRYTMQIDDKTYTTKVASVLKHLEESGNTVLKVKNFWGKNKAGNDPVYQGINTNLRTRSGTTWELQFHTKSSFDAKMATHDDYEEYRKPKITIQRRAELEDKMQAIQRKVPVPEGAIGGRG